MKTVDLFQETYLALFANKVRSGLTMLGIVIGIGSVIAMTALGAGVQASIESSIQSLGSDLIMVMPGSQRGPGAQVSQGRGSAQSLTREDADAIAEKIQSAKSISPELSSRQQITAKGTNSNTSVTGVTSNYPAVRSVEIEEGVFISDQHVRSMSKVAVLGPTARDDLFGTNATNVIGQSIRIKKIDFKVIGITKAKGGSGFTNQDDMIFIPLSTAQQFLTGNEYVSYINVQAINQDSMKTLQEDITTLLLERHGIKDPTLADFSVMNQTDIIATATTITGTLTLFLGAIAGISLIVGGIGIMNMMLTTVTERTREIGLRKAIGAKRIDINLQFLTEAVMLTFIGGFFGILLGWLISLLVSNFMNIGTKVSITSILLAFGVSATIGILFGYYPAQKAAKMNPIEALRYE